MKNIALAFLLLYAWPLFAQQGATSELIGTVTSGGQRLPGVTVMLTSDAIQEPRSAITGTNGGFQFPFLSPGDYILRFDLQGFAEIWKAVHVALAETIRTDAEMSPALHEEVVVKSAQARLEDASVLNLRGVELDRLPGAHDIRATVLLSSNANTLGTNGALVIAGAPSWDSLFLIDGVDANEYLSGQPHNAVLEDSIEEVSVLTGAISAEYGRFTGGVVSTVTKSGGNELRGSLRDRVTNPDWTMRTHWGTQQAALDTMNHAVESTLGGFFVKDHLWFFLGLRNARTTLQRFTTQTNIAYPNTTYDRRWEAKLTGQITAQHELIASFATSSLAEVNVTNFRSSQPIDVASLIPRRSQPTDLFALTYNRIVAANSSAEVQFARKHYALRNNGGTSTDRILGTIIVTRQGNLNAPFGCGICGDDQRNNNAWAVKASRYQNTRWGNHTTTIGSEGFQESRTNAGTRSASEFNIQTGTLPIVNGTNAYPLFNSLTAISWTHHDPADIGSHLDTYGGYANDRWEITPRIIVNLGLRYDRNRAKDAVGRRISNDAALNPRLGATFDIRNDGREQLFASYGRYSAQMSEGGGNNQQVGVFDQFAWKYAGPVINGVQAGQFLSAPEALRKLFAWFDSVGGIGNRDYLSYFTAPDASSFFPRSLKSPSVDERSLGYAIQWRNVSARADYIRRDWHNFYAFRIDRTTGQQSGVLGPLDIAWIVNDNETTRTYRAVQIQTSWRYRNVNAGGGYTWSRLWGNDDEEVGNNIFHPRNVPLSLWYPEVFGYPQRRPIGYLPQDERHRARMWIDYHIGSLTVSVLQWFDSGHPYGEAAVINPVGQVPNPGYTFSQVPGGAPYYFTRRDAFRTDDVFSTDVSLRFDIPVRSARLFAKADVLNAFNNAAGVSTDTSVSLLAQFNPFTTVPVQGMQYRLSPTFGQPTGPESYQIPRTFEFALGARF